jgi:hypothetical protein
MISKDEWLIKKFNNLSIKKEWIKIIIYLYIYNFKKNFLKKYI